MGLLHLLDVPLPSHINHMDLTTVSEFQTTTHTKSNNTVQPTDSEFQDNTTTRVTTTNNNTDQPTDSEFQDNTTKKDTARDTTTQDVTEEEVTEEEELASEDAAEVATEEEVTSRGAESSTVKNMVKLQERTTFENIFNFICSLFAVNKLAN